LRLNNEAAPFGETLVIPPEKNNSLEIRYQALSFIRPAQQRFRYRLAGVDADWVEAGPRRAAYYHQLPPGEYVFTVIAANSDGVWNAQGVSLRVVVRPWPWQTWWFRALIVIGVAGLVALLFQRRIVRLKREQALREDYARQSVALQEQDRRRIARDLHDSLGQRLNLIARYARDGNAVKITDHAEQAMTETHRIAHNLQAPEIERLGLTKALETLIEQFRAWHALDISAELGPLDAAFDDEGRMHLYRIVQEGFNNIVRHARATQAALLIRREAQTWRVEIRDNGQGFTVDAQRHAGLGLSGITERAQLLGGQAEIQSTPGHGTVITILFPARGD
jgi:signal transduction histidine kinase